MLMGEYMLIFIQEYKIVIRDKTVEYFYIIALIYGTIFFYFGFRYCSSLTIWISGRVRVHNFSCRISVRVGFKKNFRVIVRRPY